MKVLFINTVYGKGSTGRIVRQLGQAVEKAGGQFMAAYGRGEADDPVHTYRIGGKLHTYVHALLARITDRAGFYSAGATRKLVKFIRQYQPDVIHLHNLHGYYLNIEILFHYLKTEYTGKVIWTLHDCWAFTGHCVHYTYAKCDKWKHQCFQCPETRRYPTSLLMDNSKSNYLKKRDVFTGLKNMAIVTPSEWLAEQVKASFLKQYPCQVINNGVDLNAFYPKAVEKEDGLILNVADGQDDRKGFPDLVQLMQLLPKDYKLVVVGLQERDLKRIPSEITPVLRTSSQSELAEYYTRASWFVNTTYEETFGLVNAEALCCGTPVITYRSGGSPEVIDDSCGYVVEPGDVLSIARLITTDQRPSPQACVLRAQSFSKEEKYQQYITLYQNL